MKSKDKCCTWVMVASTAASGASSESSMERRKLRIKCVTPGRFGLGLFHSSRSSALMALNLALANSDRCLLGLGVRYRGIHEGGSVQGGV